MGRKINEDKYGISDRRYRELVYFCLQYKEWKEWLGHNDGTVPGQSADVIPGGHGKHSDPVAVLAIKREQLQNKCKILEKAAEETSPLFAKYIIKHVTNKEITYKYLNMVLHMPCSRKKYYELRKKFFWLLDKKMP